MSNSSYPVFLNNYAGDVKTLDDISEDINSLGSLIRFLRKRKGYTQSKLASMIGVQPQTVGKYETGVIAYPPIDKLQLMQNLIDDDNLIYRYLLYESIKESSPNNVYFNSFRDAIEKDTYDRIKSLFVDISGMVENATTIYPEIESLVKAWNNASEKDRKAVSVILGFEYEIKQ